MCVCPVVYQLLLFPFDPNDANTWLLLLLVLKEVFRSFM